MTAQKGLILAWTKPTQKIPVGWSVCDGTENTPDLRSQFVTEKEAKKSDRYPVTLITKN